MPWSWYCSRNASSQPLLAEKFSICKLDAISTAFACNIGPVTRMFWALHFVNNSSIILLTSSFSVFLIFHFLFCEQLLSTEFIMECSFFLIFAIIVFDTPYCLAKLRWLSPFCMRSRTSLFCCKLSSVCKFRLALFSLMQVQYSTMYCITTNTMCTIENNVRYNALTDWLIYHVAWFPTVPFTSELYPYLNENGRTIRARKSDTARRDITTCSIWLAWSTTMVNIGRYKQYPGSISRGKHKTGIQHIKVEKLRRWSYMQTI